jgi:hypothetical protein
MENFGSVDSFPQIWLKPRRNMMINSCLKWNFAMVHSRNDGKLTIAFKEKQKMKFCFLAADLGHYIADAHTCLY